MTEAPTRNSALAILSMLLDADDPTTLAARASILLSQDPLPQAVLHEGYRVNDIFLWGYFPTTDAGNAAFNGASMAAAILAWRFPYRMPY